MRHWPSIAAGAPRPTGGGEGWLMVIEAKPWPGLPVPLTPLSIFEPLLLVAAKEVANPRQATQRPADSQRAR